MRKTADYIISYDISDSKRLQCLAKQIEKLALRIQNSVYLASSVTQETLFDIIDIINSLIDQKEDDVRIYTILDAGYALGQAVDLNKPFIILGQSFS
jgi:CRISPR-associated endonuclease Cas2